MNRIFEGKEDIDHESKKLKAGRGIIGIIPVVGARQFNGAVIAKLIECADGKTATEFQWIQLKEDQRFIRFSPRSIFCLPCEHDSVNHSHKVWVQEDLYTNNIGSFWVLFTLPLHGTWHNVSPKHMHRSANEATVRLNIGSCKIIQLTA